MTTQDWKSKDTELLVAIDDCKIAALRLILAVSALLLIYLDPSEPDRHILLTNLCLKLYLVYSVAIYVIAFRKKSFSWPVFVVLEAAEIALFTVLISLSTGTNRIFFFFYFFAVLVGAMRGGSAFGFGLTIISALLFTVFGYIARPEETLEPYRFLLGPLWLLAFGCIISYWAGGEIRLKSKLALLKELSLTANPRYDVDRIIAGFMERLLVFYNTDTCVLVLADPNAQTYRLHRATRQNRNAGGESIEIRNENDCPLLDLSRFGAGVYRERAGRFRNGHTYRLGDSRGAPTTERLVEAASQIAELLDVRSFITAPMRYRDKNLGSVCLTSSRLNVFDLDDAIFLQQTADQAIPVLENVRLLDRLASEAVHQERSKIARSIHDRIIQPYLGLQIGLDAVRQSLRSDLYETNAELFPAKSLRSVELLEQLSTMTKDGVQELREYIYGLRDSDARQMTMVDSIRRYASQFADVTGIDVRVVNRMTHVTIPDSLAAEVFQMLTEALSNVRRHTKANLVVIYLETVKDMLVIRCDNDSSNEDSLHSFRPVSIADRAEALGGRTFVWSEDGCTKVQVELPL